MTEGKNKTNQNPLKTQLKFATLAGREEHSFTWKLKSLNFSDLPSIMQKNRLSIIHYTIPDRCIMPVLLLPCLLLQTPLKAFCLYHIYLGTLPCKAKMPAPCRLFFDAAQ